LILIKRIWPSLLDLTQAVAGGQPAVASRWLQKLSGAENLKADTMTGRDGLHFDPSRPRRNLARASAGTWRRPCGPASNKPDLHELRDAAGDERHPDVEVMQDHCGR
jgi:hypothetical protein